MYRAVDGAAPRARSGLFLHSLEPPRARSGLFLHSLEQVLLGR